MSYIHCKHCCPCCSGQKSAEKDQGIGSQLILIFAILLFFVVFGQFQSNRFRGTQPENTIDNSISRPRG